MKKNGELAERFTEPSGWEWGTFRNKRGADLRYGRLLTDGKAVAHIVYVEGLSEFSEKTFELSREFKRNACNFSVFDRHGQGRSPRHIKGSFNQHSTGIADDVDDLIKFCRENIPPGEPIILFAHSTGALVAMHAMKKEPDLFKGAVMTAPLFGMQHSLARNHEAFWAHVPLPFITKVAAPGDGDPLPPEAYTHDPERYNAEAHWKKKDPALQVGPPTLGWAQEMCRAIIEMRQQGFLDKIKQPLLIYAAKDDHIVNSEAAAEIARRLPNAIFEELESGHSIMQETDDIRDHVLQQTLAFIRHHTGAAPPPAP